MERGVTSPSGSSDGSPNPRPPKRAHTIESGDDGYRPGYIVEIEVHNFMCYSHFIVNPGPRLNLVTGPNGTVGLGKSSLVCAIGLGLGGEPQLLDRSTQVGDFVRRGEKDGWTKISLRGETRDATLAVQRKITKRNNKSQWLLNDRPATKRGVQKVVRQFNVLLSNLTQFLPQDRVAEFAVLTPVRLLKETEKALSNLELHKQHKDLIQKSAEMKKLQTDPNVIEVKTLDNFKITGEMLAPEVVEEVKLMLIQIEVLLAEIKQITGSWLPELIDLVTEINDTFGQNFRDMGFAGEVTLDEGGIDFDKYGICINVNCRASEKLQVVDDVSRGMDPSYKCKVLQNFVQAAAQPSTPQCLLTTPVVPLDLKYGDECTILNVLG